MLRRLSRLIVLLAAVQILGGHWVALQSAAWVGMMVRYAETESLRDAVVKTFDGEHPCTLCKAVESGRQEEQKQGEIKLIVKLEAVLASNAVAPTIRPQRAPYEVREEAAVAQTRFVPTPPPRVA